MFKSGRNLTMEIILPVMLVMILEANPIVETFVDG